MLLLLVQRQDDLATKIMTTADPETGERFETEEMVDQVVIFFLAGHETSASALAWALYLMARYPEWQDKLAQEAKQLTHGDFGWFPSSVFRGTSFVKHYVCIHLCP
jgi:cytochrome P450